MMFPGGDSETVGGVSVDREGVYVRMTFRDDDGTVLLCLLVQPEVAAQLGSSLLTESGFGLVATGFCPN